MFFLIKVEINSFWLLSSSGSTGVSTESLYTETVPGWLTGRRPTTGQLYPRGVFNK